VTYDFSATVPAGLVISQNPAAGTTVAVGSSIDLIVSLGQAVVTPTVVDMNETDANSTITAAGLKVGTVIYEYNDTVAAGHVISQNPAGGTTVPIGSSVDLAVSLGEAVTAPDVVDMNETDANSAITGAGLKVGIVTYQYSDTVVAGHVISQNPVGGTTVPAGSTIDLVVSAGGPVVPDVVGQTEPNATAAIEAVDLIVAKMYLHDDTVPIGEVISQNPVGGTYVPVGSTVNIVVSLGRPTVPGVVGQTEVDAIAAIEAVDNLSAAPTYEYHETVPKDEVISQDPAGGTTVDVGTTVNIVVSLGQPIVPDVVGSTLAEATAAIEAVDSLVVAPTYRYDSNVPFGYVISQNPTGGTPVDPGTTVNIVVSLGMPVVPGVVGWSEADATAAIEAVDNLMVGTVTYEYSNTVETGDVISQNPSGGTAVPVGSTVDLVVSSGRPLVPPVVGVNEVDAYAAITGVDNLTVGTVVYQYSDVVPAGVVISQNPTGGTAVLIGSSVDLVVSLGQPIIPDVVGMTEDEARSAITDGGLTVGNVSYQYSDTLPPDTVISQNPASGIVAPVGYPVDLVVSGVLVPDVVGRSKTEANSLIAGAGLAVGGITYKRSSTVPIDSVISQNPVGGIVVPLGSFVNIEVSGILVPTVIDMTLADANTAVTASGLVVGTVTYEHHDTVAVGLVFSQDPTGGTAVSIGSPVNVVVSLGRPEVPDVVGETEPNATSAIAAVDNLTVGLVVERYDNSVPAGVVISQDPVGGTVVLVGSSVNLVVSLGQPVVPYVVGEPEASARAAITAVDNLRVGVVSYEYSDTVSYGIVISQDPNGGTAVITGSAVDLVVSLGLPKVPNVVDINEADAASAITAVDNLTVGIVTYEYNDTIAADVVISQNPAAGTFVLIGSSVDLVVSLGQPKVPDVQDMNEADAASAIIAVDNLTVGAVTYEYSDAVASGNVIRQDPLAGTPVPIGSPVDLVVSLGQPEVPDVVGDTEPNATVTITSVDNLTVGIVTYEHNETVPAGLVISQDPVGGTIVPVGSSIDLLISAVIAPNVVEVAEANAISAIIAAGLTVGEVTNEYSDTVENGLVISQNPVGGTTVPVNSAIDIVVSLGQPVVPDVVHWSEADANLAISAVDNLRVGSVTYEYSETVPTGFVISQSPVGGTTVAVGSLVDLVVAAAVIPDLVDMTKFDANSALIAASLTVGTISYEYSQTVGAGKVISQNPASGLVVPVGLSVDFAVSLGQPVSVMVLGGNRLVELQNDDGGWDSSPLDDGDPSSGSDAETFALAAMGLAQAYRHTADPNVLAALQNAKTFLLGKTDDFVVTDGALAVEFDRILGGTACADYVNTNFYDRLVAGTYYDAISGAVHNTTSYIEALRIRRADEGKANLAAWDLGLGVYSAHVIGAVTTEWVSGVKAEIDELDNNWPYDVLGLGGAVFGLSAVGEDYDPQAGSYAAASSLGDLAATLADYQLYTGGFTWYSWYLQENLDETVQETVYALIALNEFDRDGYSLEIWEAGTYLQSVQLATGGWKNHVFPEDEEKNELTGEALRGIAVAIGDVVSAPNVVNMTEADANSAITAVGLVAAATYEYSETVAGGIVMSQNPAYGSMLLPGSFVNLVVSLGEAVTVPDVVDMTEAAANSTITAADLVAGDVVYEYNDTIPAGIVMSQNPTGGATAPMGSPVDLVVSGVVVPNVVDTNEADADANITSAGLSIGNVTYRHSDTVTEGLVISQNPVGEAVAGVGSSVDLVVSSGQPKVPDVVGMTETEANSAITAVDNLTIGTVTYEYSNTIGAGIVISQNPSWGTPVAVGSSVDLVVSLGQSTVVPPVAGQSQVDANSAIYNLRIQQHCNRRTRHQPESRRRSHGARRFICRPYRIVRSACRTERCWEDRG
jgi:beta-lactam-binding protein with PASTA domain